MSREPASPLYASILRLSRNDIKAQRITDPYSLHRVVYDLFPDTRSAAEKETSLPSGILYADKGGDYKQRLILILSDRRPRADLEFGQIESKEVPPWFLENSRYGFEVVLNPTRRNNQSGKIVPLRNSLDIKAWFIERAPISWGFGVQPESLEVSAIGVQKFTKKGQDVTLGSATLKGELNVLDRDRFIQSFSQGIGRGRAFGFGLLQIIPS